MTTVGRDAGGGSAAKARLLAIRDLAERRGVDERRVRATVLGCGVPRIDLKPPGNYVSWPTVRFRVEAVEAWEESRERRAVEAAPRSRTAAAGGDRPRRPEGRRRGDDVVVAEVPVGPRDHRRGGPRQLADGRQVDAGRHQTGRRDVPPHVAPGPPLALAVERAQAEPGRGRRPSSVRRRLCQQRGVPRFPPRRPEDPLAVPGAEPVVKATERSEDPRQQDDPAGPAGLPRILPLLPRRRPVDGPRRRPPSPPVDLAPRRPGPLAGPRRDLPRSPPGRPGIRRGPPRGRERRPGRPGTRPLRGRGRRGPGTTGRRRTRNGRRRRRLPPDHSGRPEVRALADPVVPAASGRGAASPPPREPPQGGPERQRLIVDVD